jgi:cytochrome b6-f complex iron-sulfur subunit
MSTDDDASGSPPRRDFLGVAIAGATVALGAATAYPVVRFLDFREQHSADRVEVGRAEDFPSGTSKTVLFGERPALVIRLANGEFRAFVALCSHLQCVVAYSAEHNRIECPCHRGVYGVDGKVVSGPPPRALQELKVETRDGVVVVTEA